MPLPAGSTSPPFTLPLAAGGAMAWPDVLAGRPGILAFSKDECPTCRLTYPFLQRIHDQLGSSALVAGVAQDDAGRTRAWAKDLALTMPLAVDGAGYPVSRDYRLVAVPTIFLVDGGGTIVRVEEGFGRDALASLAADLARRAGAPPPRLYRDGDTVPAMKPG